MFFINEACVGEVAKHANYRGYSHKEKNKP